MSFVSATLVLFEICTVVTSGNPLKVEGRQMLMFFWSFLLEGAPRPRGAPGGRPILDEVPRNPFFFFFALIN
jgi:hypothetical protein